MLRQLEIIDGLRERYENVYVEDKGEVFNSDLTQAIELGYMLDLAACMLQAASRARRAAERTRGRTTIRSATTSISSSTRSRAGSTGARALVQGRAHDALPARGAQVLMHVALKIWRYDSSTGDRALKEYEIDAPEEATLLDCLDIIKDRVDGTLAYRKRCRMMICGSCGMRMDGAAVLACKTRMQPIAESGHVPVISAMGNLPIVKDLVVDMTPFWSKFRAIGPWLQPGYDQPADGKEYLISQERMNAIHKEALCINCGCCVSECNAMEADPEFLGPQALAKGMRFVGDPRDERRRRAARGLQLGARHLGLHAVLLLQRALPEGRRPERRDRKARRGVDKHGIDGDMGAKHAKWFVDLRQDDGVAARDRARAEDAGHHHGDQADRLRARAREARQGAAARAAARRGERDAGPRAVRHREDAGRDGALGIVQGERALSRLEHGRRGGA